VFRSLPLVCLVLIAFAAPLIAEGPLTGNHPWALLAQGENLGDLAAQRLPAHSTQRLLPRLLEILRDLNPNQIRSTASKAKLVNGALIVFPFPNDIEHAFGWFSCRQIAQIREAVPSRLHSSLDSYDDAKVDPSDGGRHAFMIDFVRTDRIFPIPHADDKRSTDFEEIILRGPTERSSLKLAIMATKAYIRAK
jgi:hypothetical protein